MSITTQQERPKRTIIKLRDLVGKVFEYEVKWSGSSKYGEYVAFGSDSEILFVSQGHKAYGAAKEAPQSGKLTVGSRKSKNGRLYYVLTASA